VARKGPRCKTKSHSVSNGDVILYMKKNPLGPTAYMQKEDPVCRTVLSSCTCKKKTLCVQRCCQPAHAKRSPSVSNGVVIRNMQKEDPLRRTVLSVCTCKKKPLCVERCCNPVHAKGRPVSNGAVILYMQKAHPLC
jgi:hypothetical protein